MLETVAPMNGHARSAKAAPSIVVAVGMSYWKRRHMRAFLRSAGATPVFRRNAARAIEFARRRHGALAVWAGREPRDLADMAGRAGVPLVRIEDGFLRSVGLGAEFNPAASIVIDRRGIYYDPSRASDLENILAETEFDAALLTRARQLIGTIVTRGITKYNTGGALPALQLEPAAATGRCRIFVPGQVEDDQSILLGSAGVEGNLDLLRRVRAGNPNAYIIYKPHPDVAAGHRKGAIADQDALRFADRIVRDVSSAAIIAAVDEIHTLTSLAGFEALLRGRHVVVYGQPFYAGWGLTRDLSPVTRRTRQLSLEELVAGVLILYPHYLDPVTKTPCTPEILLDRFADASLWRPGMLVRLRRLQGAIVRRWRHSRMTFSVTAHR